MVMDCMEAGVDDVRELYTPSPSWYLPPAIQMKRQQLTGEWWAMLSVLSTEARRGCLLRSCRRAISVVGLSIAQSPYTCCTVLQHVQQNMLRCYINKQLFPQALKNIRAFKPREKASPEALAWAFTTELDNSQLDFSQRLLLTWERSEEWCDGVQTLFCDFFLLFLSSSSWGWFDLVTLCHAKILKKTWVFYLMSHEQIRIVQPKLKFEKRFNFRNTCCKAGAKWDFKGRTGLHH